MILHPGSTTLWLGRATDHLPQSIPHVIAWRKPPECPVDLPDQSVLVREGIDHPESETQKELALSVIEQAIWSRKTSSGSRKHQTTVSQVNVFVITHNSLVNRLSHDLVTLSWVLVFHLLYCWFH